MFGEVDGALQFEESQTGWCLEELGKRIRACGLWRLCGSRMKRDGCHYSLFFGAALEKSRTKQDPRQDMQGICFDELQRLGFLNASFAA